MLDTDPDIPAVVDPAVAELRLRTAVDELCRPEHVTLDRQLDTHEHTGRIVAYRHARDLGERLYAAKLAANIIATARPRIELPPLLDRLVDAVSSSTSTGTRGRSMPAPLNLDAAQLLADIRHTTTAGRATLIRDVRAWAARRVSGHHTHPDLLVDAAQLAQQWVASIRELLDPRKRYRPVRDTPCPACGQPHAWLIVDGERHRQPALLVDTHTGWTTCRGCQTGWPPERAELLGRVLAQQRAERRHADTRP